MLPAAQAQVQQHARRLLARAAAPSRRRLQAQAHSTHASAAAAAASAANASGSSSGGKQRRALPDDKRTLADFVASTASTSPSLGAPGGEEPQLLAYASQAADLLQPAEPRTFTIESYGCQMNSADSEIVRAIMEGANYTWTDSTDAADVIYLNTCAIRENAEQRVFGRLASLRGMYKSGAARGRAARQGQRTSRKVVGLLGCMAERLKEKLLEEAAVDLVAGPDAYRDLPRLLGLVAEGQTAINVQLSQEETYADIAPVRIHPEQAAAFVSISRGCNNMCTYCIVPFTRGRERSRPEETILEEVRRLAGQGIREVVLLGQNVNSYHDKSAAALAASADLPSGGEYQTAEGFTNLYRSRGGAGLYFADLLDQVSRIDPEMRVRFTSPHPKDFPLPLLQLIAERPSLCSSLHLPAQSGSSAVLQRMRRGYTREAYLALAARAREVIPGVALSSDFIAGFCGETEADHAQTLSLMEEVGYEQAFMFAYSMRGRTHAAYNLEDDVPEPVKQRRLAEVIATFRRRVAERNAAEVGSEHLVLVEGHSKRSTPGSPTLTGRTDSNKRCVFPATNVLADAGDPAAPRVPLKPGDYVVVRVAEARAQTLICKPLGRSGIGAFEARKARRQEECGSVQAAVQ